MTSTQTAEERSTSAASTENVTAAEKRQVPESAEVAAETRRNSGFAKMPASIVRDRDLSDRALRLYAEMRMYAWESTGSNCFASQATLAENLGWGVRKVQEAASELKDAGLIEVLPPPRRHLGVKPVEPPRQQRASPSSMLPQIVQRVRALGQAARAGDEDAMRAELRLLAQEAAFLAASDPLPVALDRARRRLRVAAEKERSGRAA
jgi:hypothetical protein